MCVCLWGQVCGEWGGFGYGGGFMFILQMGEIREVRVDMDGFLEVIKNVETSVRLC